MSKKGHYCKNADKRWSKFLALAVYKGKTYKDISKEAGIPVMTLSRWGDGQALRRR